ncbi:DUF3515 family protein [Nocardioides stalactiti]|uniref:DUF3515 family protein n=1 Tax=Nocardioides stalactiti TaxID=2755356 RepID=UPI00160344EF|nr:DUF3515 family protein [Nocardioides stalactiti]
MPRGAHLRLVVAGLLTGPLLLTSCGPVEVDVPDLDGADADACAAFADDLPDTLADEDRVEIEPADAPAPAYGDPAIVVTCGVDEPEGFGPGASCEIADGARWYIPADQYGDEPREITLTSAWSRPRVRVVIPDDYWPDASAAVMAELAPLVLDLRDVGGECL